MDSGPLMPVPVRNWICHFDYYNFSLHFLQLEKKNRLKNVFVNTRFSQLDSWPPQPIFGKQDHQNDSHIIGVLPMPPPHYSLRSCQSQLLWRPHNVWFMEKVPLSKFHKNEFIDLSSYHDFFSKRNNIKKVFKCSLTSKVLIFCVEMWENCSILPVTYLKLRRK